MGDSVAGMIACRDAAYRHGSSRPVGGATLPRVRRSLGLAEHGCPSHRAQFYPTWGHGPRLIHWGAPGVVCTANGVHPDPPRRIAGVAAIGDIVVPGHAGDGATSLQ